ncbi:hypothetical protein [Actinomadura sp. 9N407]|uniref:hypothetical protein n=1 Tax=Actinomadura sp. 9N407 TaxID=3375154 RepID=UPI0037B02DCD
MPGCPPCPAPAAPLYRALRRCGGAAERRSGGACRVRCPSTGAWLIPLGGDGTDAGDIGTGRSLLESASTFAGP